MDGRGCMGQNCFPSFSTFERNYFLRHYFSSTTVVAHAAVRTFCYFARTERKNRPIANSSLSLLKRGLPRVCVDGEKERKSSPAAKNSHSEKKGQNKKPAMANGATKNSKFGKKNKFNKKK